MTVAARSESRDGARVRLLAVHTTEGNGTAQTLRDATWWTGSSHAINDEYGTLLTPAEGCVPYERAAWTLRSGNKVSENIEQVGWARWTRDEWLARPKLLDNTARWLADRSKARGIPLVKLSPADVAAGKSGVIGHVDWTYGMKDGTHTDPGPNYPWDVVLAKVTAYRNGTQEDDMPSAEEVAAAVWGHNITQVDGIGPAPASAWIQHAAVMGSRAAGSAGIAAGKVTDRFGLDGRPGPDTDDLLGQVLSLRAEIRDLAKAVAGLVGGAGPVDVKAVADQLTVVPKQ